MATFGIKQPEAVDMPLSILNGVDDGVIDVLEELGITSVQHLATMHAPEVCGRSLYPRERVLDWIDQAILALHTDGRLSDLRSLGIHNAHSLVRVADLRHACEEHSNSDRDNALRARWEEIARRLALTIGGLELLAQCIKEDASYIALEEEYPHRKEGGEQRATGDRSDELRTANSDQRTAASEARTAA